MYYTYNELSNKNWNIPKNCPLCGSKLIYSNTKVYCNNPLCKGVLKHRISKWIQVLDVKNFGSALQEFIINNNYVLSISDLYDPIIQNAISEKWGLNAVKAFSDLNSKKMITLAKLIAGFDIDGLGEELIQLLVEEGYNTVDSILNMSLDDLINIKGWGTVRAEAFIKGREPLKDEIIKVAKIIGVYVQINEWVDIPSEIEGKHVCVTGKLNNYSRKDIEKAIKERGGIMDSSVTSKTDILCTNDRASGSSKLKNAAKYETRIITENELIEMMEK